MLSDSLHVSLTWHSLVSHFALLQTLLTLVSYLASMHVALTCMLLCHTLVSLVSHFALTCISLCACVTMPYTVSYLASFLVAHFLSLVSHWALTCIRFVGICLLYHARPLFLSLPLPNGTKQLGPKWQWWKENDDTILRLWVTKNKRDHTGDDEACKYSSPPDTEWNWQFS